MFGFHVRTRTHAGAGIDDSLVCCWWADEADREKLVLQVAVLRPALRKDVSSASQAD